MGAGEPTEPMRVPMQVPIIGQTQATEVVPDPDRAVWELAYNAGGPGLVKVIAKASRGEGVNVVAGGWGLVIHVNERQGRQSYVFPFSSIVYLKEYREEV